MGLFRAIFPKRIKDPVEGTARVVGCSGTSENATSQTCVMQLVVTVPDVEPYAVEHTQILKVSRWPHPGVVLPVVVSRSEPTNLRVKADELPDWQDTAMSQAEQIAASMRGDGQPGATGGPTGQTVQVGNATVHVQGMDPAQAAGMLSMAEQASGMDLDGDGTVGGPGSAAPGATAGTPAAGGDPTDRVAALERLAELKKSGTLTDAEFEAEKAKILGT